MFPCRYGDAPVRGRRSHWPYSLAGNAMMRTLIPQRSIVSRLSHPIRVTCYMASFTRLRRTGPHPQPRSEYRECKGGPPPSPQVREAVSRVEYPSKPGRCRSAVCPTPTPHLRPDGSQHPSLVMPTGQGPAGYGSSSSSSRHIAIKLGIRLLERWDCRAGSVSPSTRRSPCGRWRWRVPSSAVQLSSHHTNGAEQVPYGTH